MDGLMIGCGGRATGMNDTSWRAGGMQNVMPSLTRHGAEHEGQAAREAARVVLPAPHGGRHLPVHHRLVVARQTAQRWLVRSPAG